MRVLSVLLLCLTLQEGEVEKIVSNVSAAYRKFKDVEMPFTQKKYISILKDPVESSGTAIWKVNRALFRTLKPDLSEVLITDQEIRIWVPETKQIEKYDRKQFKLMDTLDLGVGRNVKEMVSHYTVTIEKSHPRFGEPDDAVLLRLIPKDKQIRKYVREMWKWVRKKDHLIRRIEFKDSSGDRTVTDFDIDRIKTNQGLTDKDIQLSAPKGTKVVEPLNPDK